MSVSRICNEAKERGIKLNVNSFINELRRRDIEIRNSPRHSKRTTVRKTFTMDKDTWSRLEEYPKGSRSHLVDLGVRIVTGMPTEDVVVFIPEEKGKTVLIFKRLNSGRYQLYVSGELDLKFKQQIRKLLLHVEEYGSDAIINYAETFGYDYYGGTN